MKKPADFRLQQAADGTIVLLVGDWTAEALGEAGRGLAELVSKVRDVTFDLRKIQRMDTAGAHAMIRAAGADFDLAKVEGRPETRRLLELVNNATRVQPVRRREPKGFHELTIRIGKGVVELAKDGFDTLVFAGHLLVVLALSIANPRRVRWAAVVSQMERAGLDALPIVATTSFFSGIL